MTVKIVGILMCIMCFIPSLEAQIEIKGYVKDSLGNPLSFANVFSQEKDNTLILAFATTDDNGYFLLETSRPKTLVIKATILGYNAQELVFEENAVLPQLIEFKLFTHDLILKEAVVIGNGRVIEKSDTVTFKADAYRDSTERNLEELLKKIPGIDVDKNGTITVKGQPIKKYLSKATI